MVPESLVQAIFWIPWGILMLTPALSFVRPGGGHLEVNHVSHPF